MCGRYFLQRDPAGIARYFDTTGPTPNHPASWNIAPTQESLVVRRHPQTGARHLDVLRWGLVPRWAKDATGAARLMNARAEGIAEKPSFRDAVQRRRCLVPMDGFFEWRTEGRAKTPFAVALRSGEPMAVAGLWEGWQQPDGTWLRTFTVITTAANARQALVHPRMPAILPRADWALWLGEAEGDPLPLLRPCPPDALAFWPIHPRVGRFAENDAALLARHDTPVPPELDDAPVY
jgi:putative SOS response-associated peptidase YedK